MLIQLNSTDTGISIKMQNDGMMVDQTIGQLKLLLVHGKHRA
jgi:hypothetical protein